MRYFKIPIVLTIALTTGAYLSSNGQDLKKEVQVIRPYEPSISDANKINLQPKIADTVKVNPNFSYSIVQRPINTYFTPTPLAAARMVAEPLPNLHQSFLSIGFGNTIIPFAQAYLASKRNNEYQYGAWFRVLSTNAKVILDNNVKVKAPSSTLDFSVFGKRMFEQKIIQSDIQYNRVNKNYYGYQFDTPGLNFTNDKQSVNRIGANIKFNTTHNDSTKFNYEAQARFKHLSDKFDMQENTISGTFNLNKFLRQEQIGGEISFTHYGRNKNLGTQNNTIFQLKPWAHFFGTQWHALAGLSLIYDANGNVNNTYFFPRGYLSYDIVSHYIIPYIEIDGYIQENPYDYLLSLNPWTFPGTTAWNSIYKMVIGGGIKGKFSPTLSYHVKASYAIIDSLNLFVNTSIDVSNPLNNRFSIIYDNVEKTMVKGELAFDPNKKFHINLTAEYFQYKTKNVEYPWHLPEYNINATVRYYIGNKFKLMACLFAVGKRWALGPAATAVRLNDYLDANLGVEYTYNKRLSVFVNAHNITSARYQLWYLYPAQRFNMLAGASYKF